MLPQNSSSAVSNADADLSLTKEEEAHHLQNGTGSSEEETGTTGGLMEEDAIPAAALYKITDQVDEEMHSLLKEPNPPRNILMVTQPGAPVPSIPLDLLELLAG